MKCPECQRDTFVKDTRPQPDGTVRRRRVCRKGHVTLTWESHLNPAAHLKARERNRKHVRAWWEKLGDEERADKLKRYRLRGQARLEARATGVPVEQVFQQWGIA